MWSLNSTKTAKTATMIILDINKPIIFQNSINFKTVFKHFAQQCMTTYSSQMVEKIIFTKYGKNQINHQNDKTQ